MKYFGIIFMFSLQSLISAAQNDTLITYSEIVNVDSTTKDQLFQNARQWYNEIFVSSKEVLQIVDKETGELSGKGLLKSYYDYRVMGKRKYDCYYKFSIDIKVKDGKYKYTFSNFIV